MTTVIIFVAVVVVVVVVVVVFLVVVVVVVVVLVMIVVVFVVIAIVFTAVRSFKIIFLNPILRGTNERSHPVIVCRQTTNFVTVASVQKQARPRADQMIP